MGYYKRAVELAPGWSLPRLRLGLQYYARGKTDQAAREFESAIELDSSFVTPRWWLAHSLRKLNRLAEAERELTELVRIVPDYAPAYSELGQIYDASRQHDKAAKAFNNYLRLVPAPANANAAGPLEAKGKQ
jgi:tetratricopeptide (TPR) repeat protein